MKKFLNIAASLICCFYCCAQNSEASKEKDYIIAYNIHVPDTAKDDREILNMNMSGSGKKNITNNDDAAWAYYAYKSRLFFISDRDTCFRCYFLYEKDARGNNIKKVSNLRLEDSWINR